MGIVITVVFPHVLLHNDYYFLFTFKSDLIKGSTTYTMPIMNIYNNLAFWGESWTWTCFWQFSWDSHTYSLTFCSLTQRPEESSVQCGVDQSLNLCNCGRWLEPVIVGSLHWRAADACRIAAWRQMKHVRWPAGFKNKQRAWWPHVSLKRTGL